MKIQFLSNDVDYREIFSGYAVGSLLGGILYKKIGGAKTLRIFALLAGFSALMYSILHSVYLKHQTPGEGLNNFIHFNICYIRDRIIIFKRFIYISVRNVRFVLDTRYNIKFRTPEDAQEHCTVAETPVYVS